jgi:Ca2+-binding RTX toxin-like protein
MTSTPANSSLTDNLYLNQVLLLALEQIELYLQDFANSEEFVAKMRLAFGETFDPEAVLNLGNAWKNQDFSIIPAITILSSAELNGANGSYAAATNTIYLSQEFLTSHQGDVTDVTSVILEEIGHWVDNQINTVDSIGDEGAIFSALVQRESLSDEALGQLKAEDDLGAINLDGQVIKVEQSLSDFGGTIVWKDEQGGLHPVRGARVKAAAYVMSSDLPYDSNRNPGAGAYQPFTKDDETQTDENGKYSFTIDPTSLGAKKGIAWYFWVYTEGVEKEPNQTSIYENIINRVVDPATVTVSKPKGEAYYFQSGGYTPVSSNQLNIAIPNSKTQISGGKPTPIPYDAGRAFSIYDALYTGQKFAEAVGSNTKTYNNLVTKFPYGTIAEYYADFLINGLSNSKPQIQDLRIPESDWSSWDTILHEYGHWIAFHDKLDNVKVGGDHAPGKSNITQSPKTLGTQLGWREGLADYLSLAAQKVAPPPQPFGPLPPNVGDEDYGSVYAYSLESLGARADSLSGILPSDGEGDQSSVSRILWDLADDVQDTVVIAGYTIKDEIAIGHKELFNILNKDIPEGQLDELYDVWEYFFGKTSILGLGPMSDYQKSSKLGAIFSAHTVSPVFTSPWLTKGLANNSAPPLFEWYVGGSSKPEKLYSNDEFKILIFDDKFQKPLFEKLLNNSNLQSEWQLDADGIGTWELQPNTPETKELFDNVFSKIGTYHAVITGNDTTDFGRPLPYWSGAYSFQVSSSDQDGDGIADDIKNIARDKNQDGTPDSEQSNVASFPPLNSNSTNPNDFVTLVSPSGTSLSAVSIADNPAPNAANAPKNVDFPIGFLSFDANGISAGAATQVTVLLPTGKSANTYWKYDPNRGWYEFLYDGTTGAEFLDSNNDGKNDKIILHFVDGGRGDNDGTANGKITDPGAPALPKSNNVNDPPVLTNAIADQNAKQGNAFSFQIPTNTFTDIDAGDVLTYSATLENGNALPSWLTFNPTTRTFNGTPTNDNVGNFNVKAIATDKAGATVSDIFTITVENVNDAPIVANLIADQNAKQGNAFNFQIPSNTFADIDAGDVLTYSATLENGNSLPSWLTFNSTTRTFSGTPTNDNVGNLNVKVAATDKPGASVNDIFVIAVENVIDNQSTTVGTSGDDKLIAIPGSQFDGQNNIVFTGAGKDEVDLSTVSAFPNSGNNIVDLGSGDDTIFVNKGDRAFGSDGNDIFDARDGQGNNRMSGGVGDDTFYLGSNDRALGGDGKDIFRVSLGGGNLISGGAGADQFWIVNAELPKAANTVLDFQLGTDVIGIQGAVSLGITTSTLKLNQVGADTAIVFNNQTLATLTGIQASSLNLTDSKQFVFA